MKTRYCEQASKLMRELKIPSGDQEQIEWAMENVRSTERLIAEEKFELLGVAEGIVSESIATIVEPEHEERRGEEY
jgi:hypothetical protein